jgi:hypothetical protein
MSICYDCAGETADCQDNGSRYSSDALIYFERTLLGAIAATEVF